MARDTRKLILDKALNLFATQGFGNATMRSIAKEAEVSLGLSYKYFDSKEAILEAIVVEHESLFPPMKPAQLAELGSLQEAGKILSKSLPKVIKDNENYFRLFWGLMLQTSAQDKPNKSLQKLNKQFQDNIENLLRFARPGAKDQEIKNLMCTFLGRTINFLTNKKDFPLKDFEAFLADTFAQ